jgi:hypothetical protein
MADRTDELRSTAAQCLALAQSTTDPQTRAHHGAEAKRHGEPSAQKFRDGPAGVQ